MGQRRTLAAALVLAACSAKKASKVKATMAAWPGGHAIVLFGGEHIKSRKSGKKKYARLNDVWAFSSQTRNWTRLVADAEATGNARPGDGIPTNSLLAAGASFLDVAATPFVAPFTDAKL